MGSIILHKELGVNPRCVNVRCFVCGEVKCDSLVLLGAANRKTQCPRCKTWNIGGFNRKHAGWYECCNPDCEETASTKYPGETKELRDTEHIEQNGTCQECEEHMKKGIVMISVKDEDEGQKNPYRTGGWCVLKEEALRKIVTQKELADAICRKRMCFVPDSAWDMIGLPRGEVEGIPSK